MFVDILMQKSKWRSPAGMWAGSGCICHGWRSRNSLFKAQAVHWGDTLHTIVALTPGKFQILRLVMSYLNICNSWFSPTEAPRVCTDSQLNYHSIWETEETNIFQCILSIALVSVVHCSSKKWKRGWVHLARRIQFVKTPKWAKDALPYGLIWHGRCFS